MYVLTNAFLLIRDFSPNYMGFFADFLCISLIITLRQLLAAVISGGAGGGGAERL
jgi:hypothetical protein